jgi:hypothetical protein
MLARQTAYASDLGDVGKARRLYVATRDIWIAGGSYLEPHERLGLLTVAAGMRPFSLLNHLERDEWDRTAETLTGLGLMCSPCQANFDYQIDVAGNDAAVGMYCEYEIKYPLEGLGVWNTSQPCPTVGLSELASLLRYPECCAAMDHRTKARDHSVTLQQLIEEVDDDLDELETLLAGGRHELAWTEERHEWSKRFDQTRAAFPYALHTACDDCLQSTEESPTGVLNRLYKRLALAVSPELDLMIRWSCEMCRLSAAGGH